jgi:hypothetical protein
MYFCGSEEHSQKMVFWLRYSLDFTQMAFQSPDIRLRGKNNESEMPSMPKRRKPSTAVQQL